MTIKEFEKINKVRLIRKDKSPLMRFIGFFIPGFVINFFTTYRLPFGKPTIAYPTFIDFEKHKYILEHELMHVEQFRPWYGPLLVGLAVSLFPLPVFFSGRWFVERQPYLNDILKGQLTVDEAVDVLWSYYGWGWPKKLMRKWFNKRVA